MFDIVLCDAFRALTMSHSLGYEECISYRLTRACIRGMHDICFEARIVGWHAHGWSFGEDVYPYRACVILSVFGQTCVSGGI